MIDRPARDKLAEMIRHLVAGTVSAGNFQSTGSAATANSQDAGVRAIFGLANSMYEDDLVDFPWFDWKDRLPAQYRKDPRIRRKMALAALFLYSNTEYEWPPDFYPPGADMDCLLMLLCIACVVAALITFAFALRYSILFGLTLLWPDVAACLYGYSQRLANQFLGDWEAEQRQIGSYDLWPFMREADFDEARIQPRLLCGS